MSNNVLLKKDLVPNELPDLQDIMSRAHREAHGLTVGTTLFMREYGVTSEAEYKMKMAKKGKVMHHAHIGWNSWEETAKGFRHIYEELKKRDVVLDRFGVALDWVMGVPEQYRDKVMKGGSLIFETPEEWAAVGHGRLLFSFFQSATKAGLKSVSGNSSMIKKVYVPKYIYAYSYPAQH